MASELKVNTITEATSGSGITFAKDVIPATPMSHRNMIINGAMQVWQRGTSSTNVTSTPMWLADRWECRAGDGSTHTVDAVSDTPTTSDTKFPYALKFTVGSTAASIGAGSASNYFNYKMEGRDFYHANWGTAQAKPITLSFWVKSSVTGDYGLSFNKDTAQGYATKYTISSANTWEKKTITVTGPSSGTWQNDNGISLRIFWNWGAGSNYTTSTLETWANSDYRGGWNGGSAVQLVANANATWYITGVQLELGSVATPFENRSYADELQKCYRYFYALHPKGGIDQYISNAWFYSATQVFSIVRHPVEMNHAPDVESSNITNGFQLWKNGSISFNSISKNGSTPYATNLYKDGFSGQTPGQSFGLYSDSNDSYIYLNSEL